MQLRVCIQNFLITLICISIFLLGCFIYFINNPIVDFSILEKVPEGRPSIIYDSEGIELFRFAADKRIFVTYEKFPKHLIQAFIAAEDHAFFSHDGISLKGILRSFLINLYNRRVVQGASTITQQLVKITYLNYDRTFLRKVKEIVLAIQLEKFLTKEQIFEAYVNNIYFGRGIYGIEAAAKRFWNKTISELTLDESAVLAAVAKSAKFYSPINSLSRARSRRNLVLLSMKNLGFITNSEYENSRNIELELNYNFLGNPIRLYLQEWIRNWAEKTFGKENLYQKGLSIKTTINLSLQEIVEKEFSKSMHDLRKRYGQNLNGGLISLEVESGKIRAAIGGYDFNESQFNRAFQAVRQTGSSFKPIVYSAALIQGMSLDMTFTDEPIEMEVGSNQTWKPRNWNDSHEGTMSLVRALTYSNNIVAIKTLLKIGYKPVIDLAKKFGINRSLTEYPSLALGTAEATVEENAAAFNIFANNGNYVKPYLIEYVKDLNGVKIWEETKSSSPVLPEDVNSKMIKALSIRMQRARSSTPKSKWIDCETIGKTGSTNNSMTTWFVGSSPELTTAVYVGNDDNEPLGRKVFANQTTYPIWAEIYRALNFKKKKFYFDPSLKEVNINWKTGFESDVTDAEVVSILK